VRFLSHPAPDPVKQVFGGRIGSLLRIDHSIVVGVESLQGGFDAAPAAALEAASRRARPWTRGGAEPSSELPAATGSRRGATGPGALIRVWPARAPIDSAPAESSATAICIRRRVGVLIPLPESCQATSFSLSEDRLTHEEYSNYNR
jgi:hypothetical protein